MEILSQNKLRSGLQLQIKLYRTYAVEGDEEGSPLNHRLK